jgi:hypothetical protein
MCSTAGSVCGASVAYRLSRLGILHRRIKGAAFDKVTAFLHRFGGIVLACRRYQRGHLFLRGKNRKVWIGKWREDVVLQNGSVHRVRKSEILGTLKEYRTRRLAERALEQRLAEVNSLTYKPRPTATFSEFVKKWQADVLSQHKRSTQSADKSRIRKHLTPELGELCIKDISREVLQAFVARKTKTLSAKSVRNLIALLGEMWDGSRRRPTTTHRSTRSSVWSFRTRCGYRKFRPR